MGAFCNTRNDFYTKKTSSVIRRSEKGNFVVDRKVDGGSRINWRTIGGPWKTEEQKVI